MAKIARSEEIGRLLDSTICNNKRWITRKSFQLFLNAQNVYYILDDGDEQEKTFFTGKWEIVFGNKRIYIQAGGSGAGRSECIDSYQMDADRRISVCRSRKGSEGSQTAVPELVE